MQSISISNYIVLLNVFIGNAVTIEIIWLFLILIIMHKIEDIKYEADRSIKAREYEIRERIPVGCLISILAQEAIFMSSPGPCKFCFASAFRMILTNLDISSKEKCLTGLHQNQNIGQVALEFYLVEALSNLSEFGSEQTTKSSRDLKTTSWLE